LREINGTGTASQVRQEARALNWRGFPRRRDREEEAAFLQPEPATVQNDHSLQKMKGTSKGEN
jgi:hypothetical protein